MVVTIFALGVLAGIFLAATVWIAVLDLRDLRGSDLRAAQRRKL